MWVDPFSLSLVTPLGTAAGEITNRRGLLVGIQQDGYRGLGEATPLAGWTESYEDCRRTLEAVAAAADHDSPEVPNPTETPAAAHAVDLAVSDARARHAGQSLSATLREQIGADGPPADSVPLNATIGDGDIEPTVSAATEAIDAGFEWLKLKVGARTVTADLDRIRAVDSAVDETVRLRLDANGAWTRPQAARMLDSVAAREIEYIEQPLAADDLDGLAALRGRGTDIAVDESLATGSLADIIETRAADVVVIKPMAVGGPTCAVETAMHARAAGIEPVVTTTVDGVVARTAAVHVAAAIPTVTACGLATGSLLAEDLAADPVDIVDGQARLPPGDGLGDALFDTLWIDGVD